MFLRYAPFRRRIEEKLGSGKEIAVLFDADADGASAAALLVIYLMKKTGNYPNKLISCFHDVDTKLEDVKDCLIFILDTTPKRYDSSNFIVIDHHMIKHKMKEALFFNPREKDPQLYLPTSYLVYKILDMPVDASWIATIGIKADKAEEQCKDLLNKAYRAFPELKDMEGKLISLVSVCKNLNDASVVINSLIESYNLGGPSFFGKTPSSSRLIQASKIVYEEMMKGMMKMTTVLNTKDLVMYTVNSRMNVQGLITSKLLRLNPERTIVVCNSGLSDSVVHCEVRTNSKRVHKKLFKILEPLVEDIGGHENAFGFSIKKGNFQKMIQSLSEHFS